MSITTLHHCRSCGADVVWAHTVTGERMPIDAHPVAGGNVRLLEGRAHVVGATIDMFDPDDDGKRYVAHFVTCPHADTWRKR